MQGLDDEGVEGREASTALDLAAGEGINHTNMQQAVWPEAAVHASRARQACRTCAGLVQEHELRAAEQRQRNAQPPLHAARVAAGALVGRKRQLHLLQQVGAPTIHL